MSNFPSTQKPSSTNWGCIEDRSIVDPTSNCNQAPGADAFFTSTKDLVAEADSPGSVDHSLLSSLLSDSKKADNFTVHNDEGRDDVYGGCGYLAHQKDIYKYLSENIDDIIKTLQNSKPNSLTDPEIGRSKSIAQAASRLAKSEKYFTKQSSDIVEELVNNGANLLIYKDSHTAGTLVIDTRDDATYDPNDANNSETKSSTTFNVDVDESMRQRAESFDLNPEDAQLIAKVLSVATVRVLGADGEILHK